MGMYACASGTCTIKQALTALNVTATMCQRPVRDLTRLPRVIASTHGGVAALAALLRTINTQGESQFGWDDACAPVAGIFSIPMNVLILRMADAGLGRDTWTLPFDNVSRIMKVSYQTAYSSVADVNRWSEYARSCTGPRPHWPN
jgi:hypothetical protein